MVEKVETGGMMSFKYGKSEKQRLSSEEKKGLDKAYGQYYERRKKERMRRIIFWVVGILILIAIVFGILSFI